VYDAKDYDAMFSDGARTAAYLAAIERAVQPGSVVVEIGTGVGYFAVAACRASARHVYAIERNPIVELAERVAADNACAGRITFVRDDSRRVTLPERGDLLLSDLRGVLSLSGDHIPTIVDARQRLVRPAAVVIPVRDVMFAAPCVAPADWRRDHMAPGDAPHGIVRRAVAERLRSDWYRCHLEGPDLLADGVEWAALDYHSIESPNVSGRAAWSFARDGVADGLALWFDADLGFGVSMSNAPAAPRALYGQAFFPFQRALDVRPGDRLTVELSANLVDGDYLWGWNTRFTPAAAGSEPIAFRQSNLAAHLVSLDRLQRLASYEREDDLTSPTIPSTG
jgi:protein arginine N-methyltransferase 1